MRSLYQPESRARFLRLATFSALVLTAASCRDGSVAATASSPLPSPRLDPLAAFLGIQTVEPVAQLPGGRWLATRRSELRIGAVRLGPEPARIESLLPSQPRDSRALATLTDGRAVVEVTAEDGGTPAWLLVSPSGAVSRLGPAGGERWRLLAPAPDGLGLWVAGRQIESSQDRWLEVRPGGEARALLSLPDGLELACVSRDGRLAAATRDVEPAATELYLLDRSSGDIRWLLPDDRPGTFRPLGFSPDGVRLLLISDDRSDQPRAEWLELATGARRPVAVEPGCSAVGARVGPGDLSALQVSCRGSSELRWLAAVSESIPELPAPAGARPVDVWFDGDGKVTFYAVASGRWPRDLWRLDPAGEAHPVTYGLTPTIDPRDLVEPERVVIELADGARPAELLRPRTGEGARAVVLWLDDETAPSSWFELAPFGQYLAQRGVAVLRLLPFATAGRGRTAGGDPISAPSGLEALEVARNWLLEETDARSRRVALVGSGPRSGALAVLAASAPANTFTGVAALDPDLGLDPGRHGSAARPRVPLLVVHDPATPLGAATSLRISQESDSEQVRLLARPLGLEPGARLGAETAVALAEFLSSLFDDLTPPGRPPR